MRKFAKDDRGTVILIFGLAVIPMIALIGLAMDYTRAATERSKLQTIADAAALRVAQEPRGTDVNVLRQLVIDNINAQAAGHGSPQVNLVDTGERVKVDIAMNVKSTFSNMLGYGELPVKVSTEVVKPLKTYFEIALAMDNTGSMQGSKLSLLKEALLGTQALGTTNDPMKLGFINAMAAQAKSDDEFKVSVIPFSLFVRVPTDFPSNAIQSGQPGGFLGCVSDRNSSGSWDHDVLGTALNTGQNDTKYQYAQPTYSVRSGGRTYYYPKATDSGYCGIQRMIGLRSVNSESDRNALRTTINNMAASGNTNVPIGLAWGRNMLTHGFPTSTAAASAPVNTVLRRVVILLTDGDNTEDRWGNNNGDRIDNRTREMCTRAKSAGYEIFTIRLVNGDEALLRGCASPKKDGSPAYWFARQPDELAGVFNEILKQIITIRISE